MEGLNVSCFQKFHPPFALRKGDELRQPWGKRRLEERHPLNMFLHSLLGRVDCAES